ncbi:uncharacterized protein DNG_07353 [Cephalotrichum gorgonifer]|uniref:Major facilitator superfamily (MFS) profile domain-containing protein n=1 Tax=Cephalotrichum gorgonifer TaxID=2041049 RepID=A0AAE8N3B5_9PEZI|nr:uncharacterized protein DNG_07353 [Cephalotrichum gorgonifer]
MAGPSIASPRREEVDSALEVDTTATSTPGKTSISEIRLQLVTLGLLRATEAIAWTSIFPYVYFMIPSFDGVDKKDIPFYAGLHVAVFTFCEFLSGALWAKLSDRIGRRTTLLIGALCGMATSLSFGMSSSIAMATAARAFGGVSNPNVGLVQTCAMELARHKEQQGETMIFVIVMARA